MFLTGRSMERCSRQKFSTFLYEKICWSLFHAHYLDVWAMQNFGRFLNTNIFTLFLAKIVYVCSKQIVLIILTFFTRNLPLLFEKLLPRWGPLLHYVHAFLSNIYILRQSLRYDSSITPHPYSTGLGYNCPGKSGESLSCKHVSYIQIFSNCILD